MDEQERVATMRMLNESIASSATSSEQDSSDRWRWEFHCECGEPACDAWVELDLRGYEAARERGAGILADGHSLHGAPRARSRAQEVAADSEALREQAKHQVNRARRLYGRRRDGDESQ